MARKPEVGVGGKVRKSCERVSGEVGGQRGGEEEEGERASVKVQVARCSQRQRSQNSITMRGSSSVAEPGVKEGGEKVLGSRMGSERGGAAAGAAELGRQSRHAGSVAVSSAILRAWYRAESFLSAELGLQLRRSSFVRCSFPSSHPPQDAFLPSPHPSLPRPAPAHLARAPHRLRRRDPSQGTSAIPTSLSSGLTLFGQTTAVALNPTGLSPSPASL